MVQEVQQQGNRYQTPNEIQGIWDIRRRVKEHTQVTPSFWFSCTANWSVNIPFSAYQTVEKRGDFTSITSSYGNTVFRIIQGWLQVPLAWVYQVDFRAKWGTIYVNRVHYIRLGKQNLMQFTTTNTENRASTSRIINLWRWNLLEYYGKAINTTEWGASNRYWDISITFKKL